MSMGVFLILALQVTGPDSGVIQDKPTQEARLDWTQWKISPVKSLRMIPVPIHLRLKMRRERYLGRNLYYLAFNRLNPTLWAEPQRGLLLWQSNERADPKAASAMSAPARIET